MPYHYRTALRRIAVPACLIMLQGCAVLIPFIEPDEQAQLNGRPPVKQHQYEYGAGEIHSPRRRVPADQSDLRVQQLMHQLNHPRAAVRVNAATDLGSLGPKAKPAVPTLIARLRDDNFWVRRASAKALGRLRAKEAVPELRRCLNDRDRYVARSAEKALAQMR